MKVLDFRGPGKLALEDKPVQVIKPPTDAIVKITKTTICGTDLNTLKRDMSTFTEGRIKRVDGELQDSPSTR